MRSACGHQCTTAMRSHFNSRRCLLKEKCAITSIPTRGSQVFYSRNQEQRLVRQGPFCLIASLDRFMSELTGWMRARQGPNSRRLLLFIREGIPDP